jgi:hypothetical protein
MCGPWQDAGDIKGAYQFRDVDKIASRDPQRRRRQGIAIGPGIDRSAVVGSLIREGDRDDWIGVRSRSILCRHVDPEGHEVRAAG